MAASASVISCQPLFFDCHKNGSFFGFVLKLGYNISLLPLNFVTLDMMTYPLIIELHNFITLITAQLRFVTQNPTANESILHAWFNVYQFLTLLKASLAACTASSSVNS